MSLFFDGLDDPIVMMILYNLNRAGVQKMRHLSKRFFVLGKLIKFEPKVLKFRVKNEFSSVSGPNYMIRHREFLFIGDDRDSMRVFFHPDHPIFHVPLTAKIWAITATDTPTHPRFDFIVIVGHCPGHISIIGHIRHAHDCPATPHSPECFVLLDTFDHTTEDGIYHIEIIPSSSSPNLVRLLSAGADPHIKWFELDGNVDYRKVSERIFATIDAPDKSSTTKALALERDRQGLPLRVFAGSFDGNVRVYTMDGALTQCIPHGSKVFSLDIDVENRLLFVGGNHLSSKTGYAHCVYDLDTFEVKMAFPREMAATGMNILHDDSQIFVFEFSGTISVFTRNVDGTPILSTRRTMSQGGNGRRMALDETSLYTVGDDSKLKKWE